MTWPLVPVDSKTLDWPRKVAQAINYLLRKADMDMIARAENTIRSTYGDTVSVAAKGKTLNKFGRNNTVGTSYETVAELQGTTSDETFVSTNIIDSIVSSSGSDTQTVTIEGHTIDGSGNLTFVTQTATLNGQTEVTLTTPLARANRLYIGASGTFDSPQAAAVGDIAVYDNTDGIAAGVPNTAAATKIMITAGKTQSEKCATTISKADYWIVTYLGAAIDDPTGPTNFIELRAETRDVVNGGQWRPWGREFVIFNGTNGVKEEFDPPIIIRKNHDFRVRAKCDAGSSSVYAEVGGYLASVLAS